MNLYNTLLKTLDLIRYEAPSKYKSYNPPVSQIEKINYARSRAFIHLYLKITFNLTEFEEREKFVTDGVNDGGIDGYFIDNEEKVIYLIQAKFRTLEKNFEEKEISLQEILLMETSRILNGENCYEHGPEFSGKILGLIRNIQNIDNVGLYSYKVIILANLKKLSSTKISILTGNLPFEVYDFNRCYSELLFPTLTGTTYTKSNVTIPINLSDKSLGGRVDYKVETVLGDCKIMVLFVPTIEIAQIISKYKNTVLKYNPRSFLELEEGSINLGIRQTMINYSTNEFALYNNGITVLSDDTSFNDKIAKKDKAQLCLRNPQIINGGQSAFTLHALFQEFKNEESDKLTSIFEGKEVLLKVITFEQTLTNNDLINKQKLIETISDTTNKQTTVTDADRLCNHTSLFNAQKKVFVNYGILIERKIGEFHDGVETKIIDKKSIVDRELFLQLISISRGELYKIRASGNLFSPDYFNEIFTPKETYFKFYISYVVHQKLLNLSEEAKNKSKLISKTKHSIFAIASVIIQKIDFNESKENIFSNLDEIILEVFNTWEQFEIFVQQRFSNKSYFKHNFNYRSKYLTLETHWGNYYKSTYISCDINDFFKNDINSLKEEINFRTSIDNKLNKFKEKYSTSLLKELAPLVYDSQYIDQERIEFLAKKTNMDKWTVSFLTRALTSKELGYYIYQLVK